VTKLFNEGNWYEWGYTKDEWASEPYALRQYTDEKLYVKYGKLPEFKPFKKAVLDNAISTIDHYPNEQFNLLVSGGMDSELVLRAYRSIGHHVHAHIFRYEKDWNIYDVSHAVLMCENTGTPYTIHDFSLTKFFESGQFEVISDLAQSDRPRALVQLAFPNIIGDGLVISASSDPRWFRPHDDYSQKAHWRVQDFEHDIAMDRYCDRVGIPAIMQWFKWTPALTTGWFSLHWFSDLVADRIPGKLGVVSTKIKGYQEVFPEMPFRFKKTGFESIDHLVEPAQAHLEKKHGGLFYRQQVERSADELSMEMTGHGYYDR
jgi:hypothetical protein